MKKICVARVDAGAEGGCGRRGAISDSCNISAPSLLLPAGDFGAQGLPRVAAAHHRPAGVRACLPSPVRRGGRARGGERCCPEAPGRRPHAALPPPQRKLQRVLRSAPRHALGRRPLLSRPGAPGVPVIGLTPPRPPLSQVQRHCVASSTCTHASATFRATPALRSKGENPGEAPGKSGGRLVVGLWAGS